jgi:protein TonB
VTFGVVVALHVLVILALVSQSGSVQMMLPRVLQGVRLLASRPPPPPPLTLAPRLAEPDLAPIPPPDIVVNVPQSPLAPRAVIRVAPAAPAASHFGPAGGDSGLGLDVATSAGGGARGRGSLADFQAAVKRAVLAHKVQPSLAWDRRNTCVVNYTVSVAQNGALAGVSIDQCAVPEINAAAEAAIRAAAPFPPPPALGAARTEVHGTLVFRP